MVRSVRQGESFAYNGWEPVRGDSSALATTTAIMPIPSDTSPEAEAVQLERLRAMTGPERVAQAFWLSSAAIGASKRAIARVHPELSPEEAGDLFIEIHYGKELADAVRQDRSTKAP